MTFMEYKKTFTKEEIDELIHWFDTHQYEKELDLGIGVSTKNLDQSIPPLIHVARTKYMSPVFSGQIYMLFRIRDALIQQNKVLGEVSQS